MGKKTKFDKLNEWIKKEYDRETQEIEDSLSNDGSFDPNRVNSEELFRRIQAGIKEKEEQKEETETQKKKVGIGRYQVRKWAALFFVAIIGVFLASMTSEANRSYLMYKMQYLVGNEVVLNEGNGDDREDVVIWKEEQKAKQEIEDELGIYVPDFRYKLRIFANDAYNIQYGSAVATIEYQYGDNILNLRMLNRNNADIAGIEFQGRIIKNLELLNGAITMAVLEIEAPGDENVTLAAQWEYKEGYYQLSGKIGEKEFIKVLESIFY